jgi:hypothetical protein
MDADYTRFWSAVAVLANTFRTDDPRLTGAAHNLAAHLNGLPSDQQAAIRVDLQLLIVEFPKIALSLAVHENDHQSRRADNGDSSSGGRLRSSLPQRTS